VGVKSKAFRTRPLGTKGDLEMPDLEPYDPIAIAIMGFGILVVVALAFTF
jgi:hypothetical protein